MVYLLLPVQLGEAAGSELPAPARILGGDPGMERDGDGGSCLLSWL